MQTLSDMAKALNRSPVYLSGLQARFELPAFEDAGYSNAYFAFLRTVVFLRSLGIAEDTLLNLWHLERKLLQLLHADSSGSPTWFLDCCGSITHRDRRLLLSNYDLGVTVASRELQLGLNFSAKHPELFSGTEMGEDALRILKDYVALYSRVRSDIATELPHIREAVKWAARFP